MYILFCDFLKEEKEEGYSRGYADGYHDGAQDIIDGVYSNYK